MLAIELLEIHRREIVHSAMEVDVVDILVFVDAEGSAEDFAGLLAAQDELNGEDVPQRGLLVEGALRQSLGAALSADA